MDKMAKTYLCNVFTTAMLDPKEGDRVMKFYPIGVGEACDLLHDGFEQAVGHPATCEVLSDRLGLDVKPVRANVRLNRGDRLVVAQVVIPRLAEGQVLTKEQVEACPVQFWLVSQ